MSSLSLLVLLVLLLVAPPDAAAWSLSMSATRTPGISYSMLSPNQAALRSMPPFPRTWVPLGSVYELDGQRPNKVEFLGQSYVCYQTNSSDSNSWTVLDDACPHRLAPLSEGRIIDADDQGQEIKEKDLKRKNTDLTTTTQRLVECSYHGWAFQGNGSCVRIPQATLELQQRTIASNPKCHVQSYSTRICRNVIFAWLWPEDCLQYMQDDWRQPEYMLSNLGPDTTTYTRDLPYGWDTLLENIVDPAHVPWAHHGLQGSRQDAIAINMTTPGKLTEQGLEYTYGDRTLGMRRAALAQFRAPFVISYAGTFEPKAPKTEAPLFNLTVIMTPIKPGWSRIIIQGGPGSRGVPAATDNDKDATAAAKSKPRASLLLKVFSLFPVWLLHIFSSRFLDSDLALLHYQEQERLVKRKADYGGYCMPAPADRCIAAMRRWILEFAHICTTASVQGLANDQVSQPLLPASPLDRSALFDRWSQHSDQCKHCRTAMDNVKKWRRNALVALSAGVVFSPKFLAARLVVVACLAALSLLSTAERSMTKGGFDHYKNA